VGAVGSRTWDMRKLRRGKVETGVRGLRVVYSSAVELGFSSGVVIMQIAKSFDGAWFASLAIAAAGMAAEPPKVVLVVHGGAGVITPEQMAKANLDTGRPATPKDYEDTLAQALEAGYGALAGK